MTRNSDGVYRELERVSAQIYAAKRMGEDVNYIYSLQLQREALREEYNNLEPNPAEAGES